jgi:outer membrane protein assembly factor BamB
LWSYATGNTVYALPAVADEVVYVGTDDSTVDAFDVAGGSNSVARSDPVSLTPNRSP